MWLVQPSGKRMSQPIIRRPGKLKEIVGIGQPQSKRLCPKSVTVVKKYYFRNIITVVVVNKFSFLGENTSLGPGHTTKLYVHL